VEFGELRLSLASLDHLFHDACARSRGKRKPDCAGASGHSSGRASGGELHTLRDAGNFIAGPPKREHDEPAWLAAIQALMPVVEHGGDTMLPRIGMMKALYPGEHVPGPRKRRARKYRIIR
jgi:hypothetical protein